MDSMVSAFEHMLLEKTGELHNMKQAMDANDLAAMVRAATRTLKKSDMLSKVYRAAELKSATASNKLREEGNNHYQKKQYRGALICYNKALAYAPVGSAEVNLAYGNISALMITVGEFRACQSNIKAVLDSNCPEHLKGKLEKRMAKANEYRMVEKFCETVSPESDLPVNETCDNGYPKFSGKMNAEIPCVSVDVCVDGQNVVAGGEIKSGKMVALERAFVSYQDQSAKYTSCYYCHKICLFFVACKGCCKALFCGVDCREKCLAEFHRVECYIVGHLYLEQLDINQEDNKLAVKAALLMSLKLGWAGLRDASLDMGMKRWQRSSVGEAFDHNRPGSLLCYDEHTDMPHHVFINKTLFCATALTLISRVPDYWPKGKQQKADAMDSLSRIILHLNTTFKGKITIATRSPDNVASAPGSVHSAGWFSFASKLARSREPNMLAVGFHDHLALVALRRIKKGQQLTI